VCLCFTYASSILSLFSGFLLLSCARFGTSTRGESQHRYTSSRSFVCHRIRCFMKCFIHDFGSSIFSSHCCHCHTCVIAYGAPARLHARKGGLHVTAPSDAEAIPNVSAGECLSPRSGRSRRTLINPAANVAFVTLSASYATVTEQYIAMDHATIHALVLISHLLQCDRMFRRPLCSSLPHHQQPPVNTSTSRL